MDELTERKQQILRAVVIEYVESAEPVGSGLLVERYSFGIGPATVRHELAEMSERGYLEQPHTSAGRIPSDVGYRYYVDRLNEPAVDVSAQKQVRDLSKTEADLQGLLQETCKVLSRLTQYVSIAATVREQSLSVRNVSLTGVTRERVLLNVLFSNGMVENRIVQANPEITLHDLHEIALLITDATGGHKLRGLSRQPVPNFEKLKPHAKDLAAAAWKGLKSLCRSITAGKVVTEGTQYLLEQPEFQQDVKALGQIIGALENEDTLHGALDKPNEAGISVSIGRENAPDSLQKLAIIASRFYINNEEAGAIAVAGPTRMRYASAVPLVETAAKALTDALTRLIR